MGEHMQEIEECKTGFKVPDADAVENSGVVFGEVKHEEQVRGAVKSVYGW